MTCQYLNVDKGSMLHELELSSRQRIVKMESCKKRGLIVGGVLSLVLILVVALIVGIALTNTSHSGPGSGNRMEKVGKEGTVVEKVGTVGTEGTVVEKVGTERTVVDRCKLPVVVGTCRALIKSWYFDSQTGDCKQFFYYGCGGNENRFSSKEECRRVC